MRRRALQRDKELRDMAAQKEQLTAVVKRKTEENSALHRRLHGLRCGADGGGGGGGGRRRGSS